MSDFEDSPDFSIYSDGTSDFFPEDYSSGGGGYGGGEEITPGNYLSQTITTPSVTLSASYVLDLTYTPNPYGLSNGPDNPFPYFSSAQALYNVGYSATVAQNLIQMINLDTSGYNYWEASGLNAAQNNIAYGYDTVSSLHLWILNDLTEPILSQDYQDILGRPANAPSVVSQLWSMYFYQQSLSDVRTVLAFLPEAANAINTQYLIVLNRASDQTTPLQGYLANGGTLSLIRGTLADSAEAAGDLATIYQLDLDRAALPGDISAWQAALAGTQSLNDVISTLAYSSEASARIALTYQNALDRDVQADELATWQGALQAQTYSQASILSTLAYSQEASARIALSYQNALDRDVQSDELATWQGALQAQAYSQVSILSTLAYSQEASARIALSYQNALDRDVQSDELATWQGALQAQTYSQASILSTLAYSPEASARIELTYQDALGRNVQAGELATWQGALQAGTSSQASILSAAAYSPEAQNDIGGLYLSILSRPADTAEVAAWQGSLADGSASLGGVESQLAYSSEAATDMGNAFSTLLEQTLPTAQLTIAQQSLATGGNTLTIATQMINSSSCAQDCLSELGQVEGGTAAATDAPREQAFIVSALQAAQDTWTSAIVTVENAAMQFIDTLNPIGTADASGLSPQQLYAQDLALSQTPNVKAALATIQWCEGGGDVSYGGVPITDLSKFPKTGLNSASGDYQIVGKTYLTFSTKLGITDFGHLSQAVVATEMMRIQGVIDQLNNGNATAAFNLAAGVGGNAWKAQADNKGRLWASLPEGSQPKHTMSEVLSYYHKLGGTGN